MSDPHRLLDSIVDQLWSLLRTLHESIGRSNVLAGLSPLPGLDGTPLANRLLDPLDAVQLDNPVATALLELIRGLIAPSPSTAVRLHGWEPGGRPRTLAIALGIPTENNQLVAALDVDASGTVVVDLIAIVQVGARTTLSAGSALAITIDSTAAGSFEARFSPGGAQEIAAAAPATITCRASREGHGPLVIGTDATPQIVAQRVCATTTLTFAAPAPPALSFAIQLEEVAVAVAPKWLENITGTTIRPSMPTLLLQADRDLGIRWGSGATRAMVPARTSSSALAVRGISVGLSSDDASASIVHVSLGLMLEATPAGLPLSIEVAGVGASFPLRIGAGQAFGFDLSKIVPVPPDGLGGRLTLPFASGGGALFEVPGGFGGAMELDLGFVSVQAFALIQNTREGFSFVALMSVRFPYPGIQLGFGFSLTGVGGIVGINRRLDNAALGAAVLDGRANTLLFPVDPGRHAAESVTALASIFPAAGGHIVVGPLLELSWGGRIFSLVIGLIFDLPDPPSFSIVGRLTIALPDPAVPAVFIQATFAGQFDPAVPATQFVGTLDGSYIVALPLRGDAFMLARAGEDATLIVSAGGFHPAFPKPQGVPALRRIGLDLSPLPVPKLRAEVYFAFTASSVQFGAGLQLSGEIADCGVEGWFSFDAMCQWSPEFSFTASCAGSVAVEVFGETLAAVALSLTIQGPTPWHVHGTGSVTVLWEDISLDFDLSWGSPPARRIEAPSVAERLMAAFREPSAWIGELAAADRRIATLTSAADHDGNLLHPLSGLIARQRAVPLDVTIDRFQGIPVPTQHWRITAGGVRADAEVTLGPAVKDRFAIAHYLNLTNEQQLGARAFDLMTSGVVLLPDELAIGPGQDGGAVFETKIVADRSRAVTRFPGVLAIELTAAARSLASADAHSEPSWWRRDGSRLALAMAQPMAVAAADAPTPVSEAAAPDNYAQALRLVRDSRVDGRRTMQLLERWELR